MKVIRYEIEVTYLHQKPIQDCWSWNNNEEVDSLLERLPERNAVVVVAALGEGVDFGNFLLFLNAEGKAHVRFHDHREFVPVDPFFLTDRLEEVEFRDESGPVSM